MLTYPKILLALLLLTGTLSAQSVNFETDLALEDAIILAKKENKAIFIDTYASYCKPCKKLQKEFQKPEVANFFNEHFINVRINMERTSRANPYQLAYQIVFLPTIVFASEEGKQMMKIDHLVTSHELLSFGKFILNKTKPTIATNTTTASQPSTTRTTTTRPATQKTTTVGSTPTPRTTKSTNPPGQSAPTKEDLSDDDGKILFVMGQDADGLPPAILKEEAYFRMTLMDGSHHKAAKKYLDTQEDWSSEENIKFINDFIYDCRSNKFQYLIENKSRFEEILGKENVSQSISILVNKELERAYPHPDLERATVLYNYLGNEDPEMAAALYQMDLLYEADKLEEYLAFAEPYMDDPRMKYPFHLYRYSSEKSNHDKSAKSLRKSYDLAEKAASIEPENALLYYNMAQIAYLQQKKSKALKNAEIALGLIQDKNGEEDNIQRLMNLIEAL